MCSSILKFLPILTEPRVNSYGVGARQRKVATPTGGGGYLENYTRFELSLSTSELSSALNCLPLAQHWKNIANYLGPDLWLTLWRRLETLRTERQLRIVVPVFPAQVLQMSDDEFEEWLDAQHLSAPFFEIYVAVSAKQYRYIWEILYHAAYEPERHQLRIYVPSLSSWVLHLDRILISELLLKQVEKKKVKSLLMFWLGRTASDSRIQRIRKAIQLINTLPKEAIAS